MNFRKLRYYFSKLPPCDICDIKAGKKYIDGTWCRECAKTIPNLDFWCFKHQGRNVIESYDGKYCKDCFTEELMKRWKDRK